MEALKSNSRASYFGHNPSFRRKPESITGASQNLPGAARVYSLGGVEMDAGSAAGMTGRMLWVENRR